MKEKEVKEKKVIELTEQEKATVKSERVLKEKTEICAGEIQVVLDKYGMTIQVQSDLRIIIVPKRQ